MSAKHTSPNTGRQLVVAPSPLETPQVPDNLYPEELLEPGKGLNIREFWNVLVRNKKLLASITGAVVLLSLLLSLLLPSVYRASTTIQIERQSTTAADVVFEPNKPRGGRDYWQTQIQLLQSNTLAHAVIEKLNIKDTFTSKKWFLSSLRSNPPTPETNFLEGLTIEPLANSQLIMVHYESNDAELSSNIVNAIADTYILTDQKRQYNNSEHTRKFLQTQLLQSKQRLAESENTLDEFARENKILSLDDNHTASLHAYRKLSNELLDAERYRNNLENEFSHLATALKTNDPAIMLDTPQVQNLRKKLDKLEEEFSAARSRYGSKSRSARRLNKKVEYARGKIRTEVQRYQQALESRLAAAKLDENAVKSRLDILQDEGLQAQGKLHTYNNLKNIVSSNQATYSSLMGRIEDVVVATGIETNHITVIDKASIPNNKYKPKIKTNLLLGTMLGFFLGIAVIFLRDFMDDTITDADELERLTQLPMLGMIPTYNNQTPEEIAQHIIHQPRSYIAEAIRSIRTALSFTSQDGAPQCLFFTSSEPGEGKTSIAVNLASAYALAGENVLLIDADMRSPSLHLLLKRDNRQGLSNYLSGSTDELAKTIQPTSVTGLHVLTAGPIPHDPVELLSGSRIHTLLETTRQEFDRIILDGPPVLGLADALILGSLTDATLLAVHSESTRTEAILTSLKRLKQVNAHIIGTLLNRATPKGGYSYFRYGSETPSPQDNRVLKMLNMRR